MKKSIVITSIALLLFGFTAYAQTGWQLYDDFNSGPIDTQKWEIVAPSATITVENGKVKFVHTAGNDGVWSGLEILKNPKTIIGLKATITVESCEGSGDVKARMYSFIGKIGNDYVLASHEIKQGEENIRSWLRVVGPQPDFEERYEYFAGNFERPLVLVGPSFTMSMVQTRNQANYVVEGQGELEFSFPSRLSPTDRFDKGIATSSYTGVGTCTVYFDDVYVLRQPSFPAGNMLLLDE